jgi:hypothetical protein
MSKKERSLNDVSIFELRNKIASLRRADLSTLPESAVAYGVVTRR